MAPFEPESDDAVVRGFTGAKKSPVQLQPLENPPGSEPDRIGPTSFQLVVVLGCIFVFFVAVAGAAGGVAWYFVKQHRDEQARIAQRQAEEAEKTRKLIELTQQQEAIRLAREEEAQREAEEARKKFREAEERRRSEMEIAAARRIVPLTKRDVENSLNQILNQLPAGRMRQHDAPLRVAADLLLSESPADDGGLLSWRVHMLPAIGYQDLYRKFHLDEPWNSPHNMSLLPEIPRVFANPLTSTGYTCVVANLVLDGPIEGRTRAGDVTDGLDHTIVLVYLKPELAVPWTMPDLEHSHYSLTPESLAEIDGHHFVVTSNGTFAFESIDSDRFSALLSKDGGEIFDFQQGGFAAMGRLVATVPSGHQGPAVPETDEQLKKISGAMKALIEDEHREVREFTSSQLSWRVHLLPYLGLKDLYEKFKLDEPWNSQHNIPLIFQIPSEYQTISSAGCTRFRLLLPSVASRDVTHFPKKGVIGDDLDTTLGVYLAAPHFARPWTQPEFQVEENLPGTITSETVWQALGWPKSADLSAATWGGTVVSLSPEIHPLKLRAMLSPSGKESFDVADALKEPAADLKLIARIQPAEEISGKLEFPALPEGSTKSPMAGQLLPLDSKLRQLGIAIHNYTDRNTTTPSTRKLKDGSPSGLSWRVHLLKELGHEPLYEKFHFDEPWDSEHNKQLLSSMPEVFRSYPEQTDKTCYQILGGQHGLLGKPDPMYRAPDGLVQTLLLARVAQSKEVFWTQPDPSPEPETLVMAEYCDESGAMQVITGTVEQMVLSKHIPNEIFRAIVTCDGAELIDIRSAGRWSAQSLGVNTTSPMQAPRWDADRLKELILAMHSYRDNYQVMPPGVKQDPGRTPPLRATQLSWRVHVLPFLGYGVLYSKFRLEEPWDSPHNSQLLSMMPDCFRDLDDSVDTHTTSFMTFTGAGTPWPAPGQSIGTRIPDGSSNTIALMQSDTSVPWTKPEDYPVDMTGEDWRKDLAPLLGGNPRFVALMDGSVQKLKPDISADTLKALITSDQKEVIQTNEAFAR